MVLLKAGKYWENLKDHCHSLSTVELKDTIQKKLSGTPEDKRKAFWRSPGFKRQAFEFYANWKAIEIISKNGVNELRQSNQQFDQILRKSPTREESERNVQGLAKNLISSLEKGKYIALENAKKDINNLVSL